jgi:transcription antitermination factor NusG
LPAELFPPGFPPGGAGGCLAKLWYALHVASCTERIVCDKLDRSGIETFFPHVIILSARPSHKAGDAGKKREIEQKFFPGYCFAHFEILEKTPVVAIRQVLGILGFGPHAVSVPDCEIASVKILVTSPALSSPCRYTGKLGDRFRVKWGVFQGVEGYVSIVRDRARVEVQITPLEQAREIWVDATSVELVMPRTTKAA